MKSNRGSCLVKGVPLIEGVQLPLEPPVVQEALHFALPDLGIHAGVDALEDTGHANEDGRLQLGNVIDKTLQVAPPVAHPSAHVQKSLLAHSAAMQEILEQALARGKSPS